MMGSDTSDPISIKGRGKTWIPRDTGRLMTVFGSPDGIPQTGYILDMKRALQKSDRPLAADPIWEKVGKYTMIVGTDLHYASIQEEDNNFVGAYLRGVHDKIQKYSQGRFNAFVKEMSEKYGFK